MPNQLKLRGFTLIDLTAAVCVTACTLALAAPFAHINAIEKWNQTSTMNLSQIGQSSLQYGFDHDWLIPHYSWKKGQVDVIVSNGGDTESQYAHDDAMAQQRQQTDLLRRMTGRIEGPDMILSNTYTIPHRRYWNLILQSYLGMQATSQMFVSPADRNLLQWQADVMDYPSFPTATACESSSAFSLEKIIQRWPYSSSYQQTVATWNPYTTSYWAGFGPNQSSSNLFVYGQVYRLGKQRFIQVTSPSQKVYTYEEYDRDSPAPLYMGFPKSRPNQLFFDGSVHKLPTGLANAGWDPRADHEPNDPGNIDPFEPGAAITTFTPLSTFPQDRCGELINERYRWTYKGLAGIDYPVLPVSVEHARQAPGKEPRP